MRKSRQQLEDEAIRRYVHMAPKWKISGADAERKARQLLPNNSDADLREFLKKPLKTLSINALDPAHAAADRELAKISTEVNKIYSRASDEMTAKLNKYLEKFKEADARMLQNVQDGSMTEEEYQKWRQGQFLHQQTWEHLRDELATDASNSNDIAKSVVKGHMPDVYAENFNFGTYQVENAAKVNTSFTLYDKQTVERLIRENPKLLPDPAKGSKTALAIAKNKDLRWNRNHIQGELLQGILQGESIPDIAKRMRNVETMNRNSSMKYARTMVTAAQNAGRVDSYKRAQDMGIEMEQTWMATLDERTRDSHRQLDGESVPVGEEFSNGLRYPGDPDGDPAETYNCRCTLVTKIKGFERDFSDMSWRSSDMDYEDWKDCHE